MANETSLIDNNGIPQADETKYRGRADYAKLVSKPYDVKQVFLPTKLQCQVLDVGKATTHLATILTAAKRNDLHA